jgi:hypothetical protein
MQKETVQQFAAKLGRCPICWDLLIRESTGPDDHHICCPKSHYEPGHVCYLEGDQL